MEDDAEVAEDILELNTGKHTILAEYFKSLAFNNFSSVYFEV